MKTVESKIVHKYLMYIAVQKDTQGLWYLPHSTARKIIPLENLTSCERWW